VLITSFKGRQAAVGFRPTLDEQVAQLETQSMVASGAMAVSMGMACGHTCSSWALIKPLQKLNGNSRAPFKWDCNPCFKPASLGKG